METVVQNIRSAIKTNEARSRELGAQIRAMTTSTPETDRERQRLRDEQKGIGSDTRYLLLALALVRGKGRWTQEARSSYGVNASGLAMTLELHGGTTAFSAEQIDAWAVRSPADAALALAKRISGLGAEDRKLEIRREDRQVRRAYHDAEEKGKLAQAVPAPSRSYPSPSGKYVLKIAGLSVPGGGWSYSRGEVFEGDRLIARVDRNYGAFPHLFIEGHKDGHDYLVCGHDYQGQTVIQLDTGARRDALSEGAEKGWGFCWAGYTYEPERQILVVDGCHWACPYEVRFYDFSRPMRGWREIKAPETLIDLDSRPPTFQADGTITTYESARNEEDEDKPGPVVATRTWKIQYGALQLVAEWVDPAEKVRRAEAEEAQKKYDAWVESFRAEDPFYLAMAEAIAQPPFSPEKHDSIGQTYDGWCPTWTGKERRWCRRIARKAPVNIDLEWGVDSGPVKLVIYRDGKKVGDVFYPHSLDGLREALDRARAEITAPATEKAAE